MKKSILIPIGLWFATIVTMAVLFSSCGTGHASCDAYGQNNIDNGISEENTKSK